MYLDFTVLGSKKKKSRPTKKEQIIVDFHVDSKLAN